MFFLLVSHCSSWMASHLCEYKKNISSEFYNHPSDVRKVCANLTLRHSCEALRTGETFRTRGLLPDGSVLTHYRYFLWLAQYTNKRSIMFAFFFPVKQPMMPMSRPVKGLRCYKTDTDLDRLPFLRSFVTCQRDAVNTKLNCNGGCFSFECLLPSPGKTKGNAIGIRLQLGLTEFTLHRTFCSRSGYRLLMKCRP